MDACAELLGDCRAVPGSRRATVSEPGSSLSGPVCGTASSPGLRCIVCTGIFGLQGFGFR